MKFPKNVNLMRKFKRKKKLSIHYNTNLSVLKYDEESLIDIWFDHL